MYVKHCSKLVIIIQVFILVLAQKCVCLSIYGKQVITNFVNVKRKFIYFFHLYLR